MTHTYDIHMTHDQKLDYMTALVSEAFDVSRDDILSRKKNEEAVDARTALCHILAYQGISTPRIAKWVGISSRSVNSHLARYYDRLQTDIWFGNLIETARERTRETCPFTVRVGGETIGRIPRTN